MLYLISKCSSELISHNTIMKYSVFITTRDFVAVMVVRVISYSFVKINLMSNFGLLLIAPDLPIVFRMQIFILLIQNLKSSFTTFV